MNWKKNYKKAFWDKIKTKVLIRSLFKRGLDHIKTNNPSFSDCDIMDHFMAGGKPLPSPTGAVFQKDYKPIITES